MIGGVFNAISLAYRDTAIEIWLFSNFCLMIWAIGFIRGWWNTKLSVGWIAFMYGTYTVLNVYAVLKM